MVVVHPCFGDGFWENVGMCSSKWIDRDIYKFYVGSVYQCALFLYIFLFSE